jgi:hypothetical protein
MAEKKKRHLPPYVSYRSFWNFLDRLREAVPARIDRSYWGDKFSGSTGTQLMSALRYLNLIDDYAVPTELLHELVNSRDSNRDEVMARIVRSGYPFFLAGTVDYKMATYAQFEDALHANFQVNSDVSRKCIKFFIDMATDARIPLSPFIVKKTRRTRSAQTGRRTKQKPDIKADPDSAGDQRDPIALGTTLDKILINKFPSFDPAWPDEIKMKWFMAFDELIKRVPAWEERPRL